MKPYIKIVFVLAIVLFSMDSYGQRWKKDPTYSPHNYKHPNKAAVAKEADSKRFKDIKYVDALVPVSSNYKAQNQIVMREPRRVQVISEPAKNINRNRNYKQQFAPTIRRKS